MKRTYEEMQQGGGAPLAAGAGAAPDAASAPPPAQRPRLAPPPAPVRTPFVLQPRDATVKDAVQRLVMEDLIFAGERFDRYKYLGERPELPGPLAVSLSRRTIKTLEASPYVVCEKSDGERAMLLFVATPCKGVPPGSYLINRNFDVYSWERAAEYAPHLAAGGPTLLDGELLLRASDEGTGTGAKAVYMVFDVIACKGALTGRETFDRRMAAIGESIRLPFRTADEASGTTLPLFIMGKFFVPVAKVRDVLKCIYDMGGHAQHQHGSGAGTAPLESEADASAHAPRRVYRLEKRVNGTDGLVFTPVKATYLQLFSSGKSEAAGAPPPLLKWKFLDENTIDFRLKRKSLDDATPAAVGPHPLSIPLFICTGSDRAGNELDVPVTHTSLTYPDGINAYLSLMDRLRLDSLIVECGYNTADSSWTIRRVRDRKTRSNFVRTGWHTLEVIAENVTAEELVARLEASGAGGAGGAPARPGGR